MENNIYWITEYIKVLLAYGFIMFLWPSVVFYKILKGKSKTFWFGFCVTSTTVLTTTVILILGLVKALNPWIVIVLYYGAFIVALIVKNREKFKEIRNVEKITTGTYGIKTYYLNLLSEFGNYIKGLFVKAGKILISRKAEYFLLIGIILWGVIYFAWGAFHHYTLGCGDAYVHQKWIYSLTEGVIFVEGIYPEGMHCVASLFNILFGIEIYSVLMFIEGIHIVIYLISVYIFLKEIFNSRYTVLIILMLFLTFDVGSELYSITRLQWALPQEFAFCAIFLCAAFLLRYLKDDNRSDWKHLWNENLIVFMLSIAMTLSVHYYATIIAFFICLICIVPYMNKIVKFSNFKQLFICVVIAVLIAVIPIAGALATGYKFQKSIDWALSVIEDSDPNGGISISDKLDFETREENRNTGATVETPVEQTIETNDYSGGEYQEVPMPVQVQKKTFVQKVQGIIESIPDRMKEQYHNTYYGIYDNVKGNIIFKATFVCLGIWLVCTVVFTIVSKKTGKKLPMSCGYLIIIILDMFFIFLFEPTALGIPSIVEGGRLCSFIRIWNFSMLCIGVDLLFTFVTILTNEVITSLLTGIGIVAIYTGCVMTGNLRGYLSYELTRYDAAVMVTKSITDNLPEDQFTIVSTVDELYSVIDTGFHEEALDFVNKIQKDSYKLTTPYVLIYIEKEPLYYAQNHFFEGPAWIAGQKYYSEASLTASQCPNIIHSELDMNTKLRKYSVNSKMYSLLPIRTEIESDMYIWSQKFMELYPGEMNVYYEDDQFLCYYFKQNPRSLYELAISW